MFGTVLQRLSHAVHSQPSFLGAPHLPYARQLSSTSPAFISFLGVRGIAFSPSNQRVRQVFASGLASSGDDFKPRQFKDAEAHEVVPKVFLGSLEAAKDKESLESNGVTHILTVNGKEPAFKDDFQYKVLNFGGENGPLTLHLDGSMAFVDSGVEKGGVLIHCTHGTGRSAAMTVAAAMKALGKEAGGEMGDFDEALNLVKERRPGVKAAAPFLEEVKEWGKNKSG